MARLNWERERHAGRETEAADPVEDTKVVTIRCRKCGHSGEVRRWQAQNKQLRCSKCGWRGMKP